MKRLIVCVDDFGLHAGVNAAALSLADRGRVCAVSCMVGAPAWHEGAPALRAMPIDIGLHLDFGHRQSWAALVRDAYLGRLPAARLRRDIGAQLDAFENAIGAAPHFVDGHRHVHQLPGVRHLLVAELARRYPAPGPWVRCTLPAEGVRELKPWVIAALGARGLRQAARRHRLPGNRRLVGVYGFDGDAAGYARRLRHWLSVAGDGDLLMCHPATMCPADDPIADARIAEYQVLGGPLFPQALAQADTRVARPHFDAAG